MNKIRNFIKENNLTFKEGSRNTDCTIITGYSQFLEVNKEDLQKELAKEIKKDSFILKESNRLWEYCSTNNYADWWKTKEAKKTWKF